MTYMIDSNIPVPVGKLTGRKYPFAEMQVGDSFFAPVSMAKIRNALAHHKMGTGVRFAVRTVTENGVDGARCWRVA